MRLRVEEEEGRTRIAWPLAGGEWRRRGTVLLMALGLASCGVFAWASLRFGRQVGHVELNLPLALGAAWVIGRHLLRLARGSGEGLLELDPQGFRFESGGGWQVLYVRKGDCLAPVPPEGRTVVLPFRRERDTFLRYVLRLELGYFYWRHGLRIRLPSGEEAARVAAALATWRAA